MIFMDIWYMNETIYIAIWIYHTALMDICIYMDIMSYGYMNGYEYIYIYTYTFDIYICIYIYQTFFNGYIWTLWMNYFMDHYGSLLWISDLMDIMIGLYGSLLDIMIHTSKYVDIMNGRGTLWIIVVDIWLFIVLWFGKIWILIINNGFVSEPQSVGFLICCCFWTGPYGYEMSIYVYVPTTISRVLLLMMLMMLMRMMMMTTMTTMTMTMMMMMMLMMMMVMVESIYL